MDLDLYSTASFSATHDLFDEPDECDISVTLHVQQRNGKKSWTIVTGLDTVPGLKIKSVLKRLKKKLCCNASIQKDDKTGESFVSFQGQHATLLKDYLIQRWKVPDTAILIKGI